MALLIWITAIFLIWFFEKLSFYNVNKIYYKNFLMFLLFLNAFIWLIFFNYIFWYNLHINFISDNYFYLLLLLEVLVIFISKFNYNFFKNNFLFISFSIFSSVYLIPIISYLYFNFIELSNNNIIIYYNNIYEALFVSFIFILLSFLYFYDKIKLWLIKNKTLLIIHSILLVNTMFFSVYIIQKYDWFSAYIFIFWILSLIYFLLSFFYERKYILSNKKKVFNLNTFLVSQSWILWTLLWQIWAKLVAVEFVVIIKRLWQLISWFLFDKYFNKSISVINKKDFFIILLIFILVFVLYFYYN